MKKLIGLVLLLTLLAFSLPAHKAETNIGAGAVSPQAPLPPLPLRFDHYYPLDQVYEALRLLNKAYPALTTLEEVGKSDEGRPLMAMTINNPKTGPALGKPGVYVDGNIHGNEIQGGEIALYLLDYLLGNYGRNEEVTALIDRTAFYVVPWSTWTAAIISSRIPTIPAPTAAFASRPTTTMTA